MVLKMDNLNGPASVLWRGKYLIVIGVLVALAVSVGLTRASSKVYESSALIQVAPQVPTAGAEVLGVQQASQDLASTYATLINSRSFLARIRGQVAGGRYSVSGLAQDISAKAVTQDTNNTNLIELTGHAGSPAAARFLTQEVADTFVRTISADNATRAAQQQQELESKIAALTTEINKLNANSPTSAEQITALKAQRAALTDQLANTIAQAVGRDGSVSVVAPAITNTVPVKPRPLLNAVLGAMLGLLVGIGAAWLRSVLDRELHSSEEVESLVGLPVLASIPLRRSSGADDLVTREAYDILRTNLTFLSLEKPLAVLTVTSSESGEGKTAAVEGLGLAARRRDLKVLLIDGDLRTAQLSTRVGASNRVGFVNVIAADASLDSALVELRPGLSVLPAGPSPPNPPSLLASPKAAKLMDELRRRFELIVIDSPPTGHLADAALLAAISDASVLVARAGQTDRAALAAAVTALKRTPAPIAGVVVFERRTLDPVYYPAGTSAREQRRTEPALSDERTIAAHGVTRPVRR
jgi:capsular exopolysaccharide synthesis family protein